MLLHFPQIHTNKHLTWIENVDFGKFFLTGLEELLFKRGKTPFYRVFICVCETKRGEKKVETEEYRNIFLNGSRGNISWEEKKYHFVTWRKSNRVQQEGIIDCKRNYSKTKGENPTEPVLPIPMCLPKAFLVDLLASATIPHLLITVTFLLFTTYFSLYWQFRTVFQQILPNTSALFLLLTLFLCTAAILHTGLGHLQFQDNTVLGAHKSHAKPLLSPGALLSEQWWAVLNNTPLSQTFRLQQEPGYNKTATSRPCLNLSWLYNQELRTEQLPQLSLQAFTYKHSTRGWETALLWGWSFLRAESQRLPHHTLQP